MSNMIECGTCGYPLTPEERTSLIEHNGRMVKPEEVTDRDLLKQALEALERCVATCFDAYAHEQVMSKPEHFVNQNITALRERLGARGGRLA